MGVPARRDSGVEPGSVAATYALSVRLVRVMPTGRLRRIERRLRRRARHGQLDAPALTLWAAMRAVLAERGVRLPESDRVWRW